MGGKVTPDRILGINEDGYERYLTTTGYVNLRMPGAQGPVQEHRYVMEKIIGRPLVKGESVHHKNGDRADNHPENLELWVRPQPAGQRLEDLLEQLVESYPRELLALLGAKGLI